jgi:hypothetical protein
MLSEIVFLKKLGWHLECLKHLILIDLFEIPILKRKDRDYFLVLTRVVECHLPVSKSPLTSRDVVRLQNSRINYLHVDICDRNLVVLLD